MKERVVFQTNVPVTVALAYPDGIEVEGRYGDQVMYTLTDERVMYVPPIVRTKLTELGIGKDDPFSICKSERREGNRRFIEWMVDRVEPDSTGADVPDRNNSPDPSARCRMPAARGVSKPNGKAPAAMSGGCTASASLRAALAASIDAAVEAERYACEHGLSVRFGSEDLRAMALSLFIQHARDGGVR